MTVKTLPLGAGSAIKSEANGDYSREVGVLASGLGLVRANTVMGRVTSGGALRPYDNDATDGSQTAVGVLVYDVDTTDGAAPGVIVARAAEVWASRLVWASTVTTPERTAAFVELAAAGIIVR